MENDLILAKQTDLLINIIFNFEAYCFRFNETFLVGWSSVTFSWLSFSLLSGLIKYHPLRIEPSTAILCQGTLLVSCAVLLTITNFFNNHKLISPPHTHMQTLKCKLQENRNNLCLMFFREMPENLLGVQHTFIDYLNEYLYSEYFSILAAIAL